MTSLEPLIAYLHVPEREYRNLAAGQAATLQVDALSNVTFEGIVARISPVIDPATGTFKVTIEIDDPTRRLRPGMFGRVDVVYDNHVDALQIPRSAILEDAGDSIVYVVDEGKAPGKPEADQHEQIDTRCEQPEFRPFAGIRLRFPVPFFVENVLKLVGEWLAEPAQVKQVRDEIEPVVDEQGSQNDDSVYVHAARNGNSYEKVVIRNSLPAVQKWAGSAGAQKLHDFVVDAHRQQGWSPHPHETAGFVFPGEV